MQRMPELLRCRKLRSADVDGSLIGGSWKRLVFAAPGLPDGAVDKNAYVFCVLTQFHRHLKRREIYANASTRWRDPRAQLLAGDAWRTAKPAVLTALSLPAAPDDLLAEHARTLDAAYRAVGGRLAANTAIGLDAEGQLHIERLEALEEPASLIELRRDVNALLPRVDLPEVILEVMSWEPGFVAAFIAASGGQTRLADLHVTIAACLTAHALNIGYSPIVKKGVPARVTASADRAEGLYWRYESQIKTWETAVGSVTAAVGEMLAFRREAYQRPAPGMLTEDFVQVMLAAAEGWRVVYVPDAVSLERASSTLDDEAVRRSRLVAGTWQATWQVLPRLALRRPGLAWQVASHKALRPLVPWALLAIAASTLRLAPCARWARWMGAAQCGFYATALIGWRHERSGRRNRWCYLPYYFCRMNLAALKGLWSVLLDDTGGVWERVPRA